MSVLGQIVARSRGQYGRGQAALPKAGGGVPDNPLKPPAQAARVEAEVPVWPESAIPTDTAPVAQAAADAEPVAIEPPATDSDTAPAAADPPAQTPRQDTDPAPPPDHVPLDQPAVRTSQWRVPASRPPEAAGPGQDVAQRPDIGAMVQGFVHSKHAASTSAEPSAPTEPIPTEPKPDKPTTSTGQPARYTPANPAPRVVAAAAPTDVTSRPSPAQSEARAMPTDPLGETPPVNLSIDKLSIEVTPPPAQPTGTETRENRPPRQPPKRPTWSVSSQLRRAGVRRL